MRTLKLEEFVDEIYEDALSNADTEYVFFLGAGCSKSSGIPLASELAKDWYEELKKQTTKFDNFNEKNGISEPVKYAKNYFKIFEALFPTPLAQQKEIQRITEDKLPSLGYYTLSSLMKEPSFNTVVTTNFDNLIQDALIYSGHKRALVITHQDLAKFIKRDNTPLITKVHGDAHMHPCNNRGDTQIIPTELKSAIQGLFINAKVICIGYGGDDKSIADLLEGCKRIDQVYWLNATEPTDVEIKEWWKKLSHKTYIEEYDFDKIMLAIKSKFKISKPDFKERAKKLENSYENAREEEIKDMERTEDKTPLDYFILGITYYEKGENDKSIEAYSRAIKLNPKYADAYNNTGVAYYKKSEYDKAIESYKKAIELNPQYSNAYNNIGVAYAKNGENDKAIESFKKAIEINPKYANAYTNLFELQIIQNQIIDKDLEEKYVSLFEKDKDMFMKYEMLKIVSLIAQNREVDIVKWQKDYEKQSLGDWSFDELETWASSKDDEIKKKLLDAIDIFRKKV